MEDYSTWYIFTSLVLLILIYRFFIKPYRYWQDRGIPSAPAVPIFGSLHEHFFKQLHEVVTDRYKKYGRIYGYYECTRPVLSVGDPDVLKDILIKDFHIFTDRRDFSAGDPVLDKMLTIANGETWKRIRSLTTPAFSSGKIKKMFFILTDSAKITAGNFEKLADSGEPADCKKLFGAFALDVIARSAFGTELDSHNDPENEFVRCARGTFTRNISLRFIIFFLWPGLLKFFRSSVFNSGASEFYGGLALKIIKMRRDSGQKHNDFLQLVMDASEKDITPNSAPFYKKLEKNFDVKAADVHIYDDQNGRTSNCRSDDQNNNNRTEHVKDIRLSQEEVIAQCIIFMLAGYDTTSSTLSLTSYYLALNPEWQEKVIREVDEVLKKNQNTITYEAVQDMQILENSIWETLRMHSPVIMVDRVAKEDYVHGKTGLKIPKGMLVSIPIYAIHHDPDFYEDPEKFDPNRFTPEEKLKRNSLTYLPFGAGPRQCIGLRLSILEIKFCLAVLLSRFRFRRRAETKVPLEFFNGPGLLQPRGILLTIERRNDCVNGL